MTARTYIPPPAHRTGSAGTQARPDDTQSGWYFDRAFNYQETGFLDAPAHLPSGSVRAVDCANLTLGLVSVERAE